MAFDWHPSTHGLQDRHDVQEFFLLLFKSSKFITTRRVASSLLKFKRTVKNCLKVEGNFKY